MTWEQAVALRPYLGKGYVNAAGIQGRRFLFDRAQGRASVLEIGTYTGMTAIAMAVAGARVVTVDLADVNAEGGFWSRGSAGRPSELAAGLDIEFVTSSSLDYLRDAPSFDMAFLDGSHLEDDVYAELCLVKAPLIVLHDVFPEGEDPGEHHFIPGPWAAMKRYCKERGLSPQFVREYHGEIVRMGVIEA